jgi:hypothetical protein
MHFFETPAPVVVGSILPQLDGIAELVNSDPELQRAIEGGTWLDGGLDKVAGQLGRTELKRQIDEVVVNLGDTALSLNFAPNSITFGYETAQPGEVFRKGANRLHNDTVPQLTIGAPASLATVNVLTKWAVGKFSLSEEEVAELELAVPGTGFYMDSVIKSRAIERELLATQPTVSVITFMPGDIVHSVSGCYHQSPSNTSNEPIGRYFILAR